MPKDVYAHFIGAGGAGMSGIALVLHQRGYTVTGSDLKESRYSRALAAAGMTVHIGHRAEHLGDPDIVVVSTAIPDKNPELAEARARGMEVWPRARMLAHLAEDRRTIAVAGTHGKTSTSSMVATMLMGMGEDPSFLIGGEIDGINTNASNGTGPHYVVEADESDGSFLFLDPYVSLVTNIEADHLDHYASIDEIIDTFAEFMSRTASDGCLVISGDDERLMRVAEAMTQRKVAYGSSPRCDVRFSDVKQSGIGSTFQVEFPNGQSVACKIGVPGLHMVSNACGALATAWALGLDVDAAATALASFSGVRRRFDLVGEVGGITIVDDYAHHPTEVAATLAGASELGFERVWVLFQPHRYSRTEAFAHDFGQAFSAADRVILMDVYSAGEAPIPGVSGKSIVDALLAAQPRARAAYLPHRVDVVPYLAERLAPGDLVMTMGAGDVTAIGPELLAELTRKAEA